MKPLMRYLPKEFFVDFIGVRMYAFAFSAFLIAGSLISVATIGLTFGIDFAGGIKIDARSQHPIDLPALRSGLEGLGLGDVNVTTAGADQRDVIIRVQQQEGGDAATSAAVSKVQTVLQGFEIRSTEVVGPKVGAELVVDGALAIALALIGIAIYVWLRFEWQFALGACLSLTHDVISTIGIFSVFRLEFDLNTVAAILTIAGFSINDTVVVYDRVREMMRKYKKLSLPDLLNLSLNKVLSRTLVTNLTATLAVLALVFVGGSELEGFSLAMLWGMFIGSYSTIYVALPVLVYFEFQREEMTGTKPAGKQVPEYERA